MSDGTDAAWYADGGLADDDAAREAVVTGTAPEPQDWPGLAVSEGYADSEEEYYDRLHEVTVETARAEAAERERADDQQLIHAVRAVDDCEATANELAERVTEWAQSRYEDVQPGVGGACEVAVRDPEGPGERRLVGLARQVAALDDEAAALRRHIEETTPTVAPNLSALAGPVLAARLISLAGGLEELAKKPSGTVQVLGAEDALFAHLQGGAPSPKHGVIYTHEFVRSTAAKHRGSAARALAGKLSIAARIDHYSGDLRPDLERELQERIETIRARDAE